MLGQGTTTFECKSGYGLTVADEARCVALAAEFTDEVTYLGAHVVPAEFAADPAGYVDLVCGPMLDRLRAALPLGRRVLRARRVRRRRGARGAHRGLARGLLPRIHASQLGPGPGIRLAVELGAASADHCTFLTDADVAALASSRTVATLLPGAEFSTRQPYPDARRLLDAGATVALATDCNPGTSYTTSMPFCVALAVRDMRMTTEEAVWSATAGGARALRRDRRRLPGPRRARRPGHPRRPVPRPPRVPPGRPLGPRGLPVRLPPTPSYQPYGRLSRSSAGQTTDVATALSCGKIRPAAEVAR